MRKLGINFGLSVVVMLFTQACRLDRPASDMTSNPTAPPTDTTMAEKILPALAISIPFGQPPVLDGTISPGEWKSAAVYEIKDGSELLFMQAEGNLYVGIRASSEEMIAANVYLEQAGKIAILHTSAALGTAVYQEEGNTWRLQKPFDWCCRSTIDSEASRSERQELLDNDLWSGINSRNGAPNEIEYQIQRTETPIRLAIGFLRASAVETMVIWPPDLNDDAIKPMPGGLPESLPFEPYKWVFIDISE